MDTPGATLVEPTLGRPENANEVCIYGLVDPRDEKVHYVGQTVDPQKRCREHLSVKSLTEQSDRAHWILDLMRDGYTPSMRILEVGPAGISDSLEKEWIAELTAQGKVLVNGTTGGRSGTVVSDAAKDRFAASARGARERAIAAGEFKVCGRPVLLNEKLVVDLRRRAKSGEAMAALADEMGLNRGTVYRAIIGHSWRSVDPTEPPLAISHSKQQFMTPEQVLRAIQLRADGLTFREIGVRMGFTLGYVKNRLRHEYRKEL